MGKCARAGILITLVLAMMVFAGPGLCGNLDDPGLPSSSSSAMHTLTGIYNRLTTNATETKRTGPFTEPSSGPGSTGYTLDQVYDKAIPTQVPKTGQTTSYATGDDGDLEKGVTWPSPRFTDNTNGTVTDNLTGLIWLKKANCPNAARAWATALTDVTSLNSAGTMNGNNCGDTSNGGSHQTDWRLPNRNELASLVDAEFYTPALSNDAGTAKWGTGTSSFTGVQSGNYWSSTTYALSSSNVSWDVDLNTGGVYGAAKADTYYVWPVRGGQ